MQLAGVSDVNFEHVALCDALGPLSCWAKSENTWKRQSTNVEARSKDKLKWREHRSAGIVGIQNFVVRASFVIRHSDFVIFWLSPFPEFCRHYFPAGSRAQFEIPQV
jgi:hypothetical protein